VRLPELVAVGASLGGLKACELLLSGLPATFSLPIVIVQHRRPEGDGRISEILRGRTPLCVCEPEDKQELIGGTVYIAPPGYHLLVERGLFELSTEAAVLYARPSVDVLFESVADAYGEGALGVILTGSNEDGVRGAVRIKRAGGTVWVQDPKTAEDDCTIRAVLAVKAADEVLALEQMSRRLSRLDTRRLA